MSLLLGSKTCFFFVFLFFSIVGAYGLKVKKHPSGLGPFLWLLVPLHEIVSDTAKSVDSIFQIRFLKFA